MTLGRWWSKLALERSSRDEDVLGREVGMVYCMVRMGKVTGRKHYRYCMLFTILGRFGLDSVRDINLCGWSSDWSRPLSDDLDLPLVYSKIHAL